MKFLGKTDSFQEFLFEPDVVNQISPHEWWKAHFNKKNVNVKNNKKITEKAVLQLFTAAVFSAAVEGVFSTHGLVHFSL